MRNSFLNIICDKYSLPDLKMVENSIINNSRRYILTANDTIYYLKEKAYFLKSSEYILHLEYHDFLNNTDVNVPFLKKTIQDEKYICFSGLYFEMMQWLPDTKILKIESTQTAFSLGISIGDFLKNANKFRFNKFETFDLPKARFKYFPERPFDVLDYFLSNLNKVTFLLTDKEKSLIIGDIEKNVKKANDFYNKLHINMQFIHGDLFGDNILTDNKKNWFIDFDTVHWGYRLSEITYTASILTFFDYNSFNSSHTIMKEANYEFFDSFISGVNCIIVLNKEERLCMKWWIMLSLIRAFVSCYEFDDEINLELNHELLYLHKHIHNIDKYLNF